MREQGSIRQEEYVYLLFYAQTGRFFFFSFFCRQVVKQAICNYKIHLFFWGGKGQEEKEGKWGGLVSEQSSLLRSVGNATEISMI